MATPAAERNQPVRRKSRNVFADLGFPDVAQRQAKLRLAYALNQALEERKLSPADAAKVLGATQPKFSALRHYKLSGSSVERLMNLLTAVDQDVRLSSAESLDRQRAAASASSRHELRQFRVRQSPKSRMLASVQPKARS